jgi:hypothetical protein
VVRRRVDERAVELLHIHRDVDHTRTLPSSIEAA